jgi:hypothetical protein
LARSAAGLAVSSLENSSEKISIMRGVYTLKKKILQFIFLSVWCRNASRTLAESTRHGPGRPRAPRSTFSRRLK